MGTVHIIGNTIDSLFESKEFDLDFIKEFQLNNDNDKILSFIKSGLERHSVNLEHSKNQK